MAKRTMDKGKATITGNCVVTFTPSSVDAHEWHISFINSHASNTGTYVVRFIDYDGATANIVLADPGSGVTVSPAQDGQAKTYTIPAQACQVTVTGSPTGFILFKAVEIYDFVSDGDYPSDGGSVVVV